MVTELYQGAEAKLYLDKDIVKERFEKKYRHPKLDHKLRKSRTRREGKVISKLCELGISCPDLIEMDDKAMRIKMSHIPGKMVKEAIDDFENKKDIKRNKELCCEIGEKLAEMHNNGIIHQDLTTSNMILNKENNKIYFIDFGLSFFSVKEEDKAVDIHLFKHALESKHYKNADKYFAEFILGYKKVSKDFNSIMKRFEKVELRGKNKAKH